MQGSERKDHYVPMQNITFSLLAPLDWLSFSKKFSQMSLDMNFATNNIITK
jgi:hypothetical protein